MLRKILSVFKAHFYFTNIDPRILLHRIESLESNEKILVKYIIALSRLQFINATVLDRETKNDTANADYLTQLSQQNHETHQEAN